MSEPVEPADPEISRASLWVLRIVAALVVGVTVFFLVDAIIG